ncbi:methyl-accepting chemotaxis protein [Ornithinibacillus bavariensis]|uniref:methyl-accepting chemotaxis protein n=1 Tax=Ornithinibacillus bavariensis TaxID=545502 RepID=UPI003D218D94
MLTQIRFKLPFMMALLLIIPMSIVGLLSFSQTKVLEQAVINKEVMENIGGKFKKVFLEYEKIITDIAAMEELDYQSYTYSNDKKDDIVNMPNINDPVKTAFYEAFLKNIEKQYDYLLNTYFATLEGEFYLSNIPPVEVDLSEFDPRQREWYMNAEAADGDIIWTEPYMDTGTGKSTITLAKAMVDENGKIVGVVGLDFDMQKLARLVRMQIIKNTSIIGGISLLIGIFFVYLFVRRFNRSLSKIQHGMEKLATGDLRTEIVETTSKDELGQLSSSYNKMLINLKELVTNVIQTSEQVATSSEQLSANSEETSKATDHITRSIQEVTAGTDDQLSKMKLSMDFVHRTLHDVNAIQKSSQAVSLTSEGSSIQARKGRDIIHQAVEQMHAISDNTKNTSTIIYDLEARSKEIEKILSIINDIANQTNLLSLNAAIEAARAGEHGKGFAVVADEVRKLAEQSSESTKQISQIINEIQQRTGMVVDSMKTGEEAVGKGTELVQTAGDTFINISDSIDDIVQKMCDVSKAITQISINTDDLVTSMENVSNISEKTSTYMQEVAGATEEQTASMQEVSSATRLLADMAIDLQNLAERFKI